MVDMYAIMVFNICHIIIIIKDKITVFHGIIFIYSRRLKMNPQHIIAYQSANIICI